MFVSAKFARILWHFKRFIAYLLFVGPRCAALAFHEIGPHVHKRRLSRVPSGARWHRVALASWSNDCRVRRIGVCGFGLWPSHGHRAQVATRDEPAESSAASPAESTGAECAGGFEAGTGGGAQVRAGGGSAFTRAAFARAAAGRAASFPTCVSAFSKRDASESDPVAAGGTPLGSRSVDAEGSAFDARSLDA